MENKNQRLLVAQWIFERQLNWIASAELKTGVAITVAIAMLGSLASSYTSNSSSLTCYSILIVTVTGFLLILSLIFSGLVILPRLNGQEKSLLFFGVIPRMTAKEYTAVFLDASEEQLISDFTSQIHRNAEIATTKHKWAKRAVFFVFLSLLPWILSIIEFTK